MNLSVSPEHAPPEPWVDIGTLAKHLSLSPPTATKLVTQGRIPGFRYRNGKRTYWRFKLSQVDAAMMKEISARDKTES